MFWVVTDAFDISTLGDIVFQADLRNLELQIKGGLSVENDNVTLFTKQSEAMEEAKKRIASPTWRYSSSMSGNGRTRLNPKAPRRGVAR